MQLDAIATSPHPPLALLRKKKKKKNELRLEHGTQAFAICQALPGAITCRGLPARQEHPAPGVGPDKDMFKPRLKPETS